MIGIIISKKVTARQALSDGHGELTRICPLQAVVSCSSRRLSEALQPRFYSDFSRPEVGCQGRFKQGNKGSFLVLVLVFFSICYWAETPGNS